MNALLLTLVLSALQTDSHVTPTSDLTPPPMPPPVEVQPLPPPQPFVQAPEPVVDAPVQRPSNGPRIGGGVALLAGGHVASIANTSVFWFSGAGSSFGFGVLLTAPLGIVISAIPLVGPALGIFGDLGFLPDTARDLGPRIVVNLVSLAAQVTGFVLLVTTPRAPKQKRQRVSVTGFGVAPADGGVALSLGGTF